MIITIRRVDTPAQCVDIEELAVLHHTEFGCGREFDKRVVGKHAYYAISDPERKYINGWVAYDQFEVPVGYIVGTIRDSCYSERTYAIQEMWFVLPKARKSFAALHLIKVFEEWAIERGVERIYAQVEHDHDDVLVERIFKMMRIMGYKKQGYVGVKQVGKQQEKEVEDDRSTHRAVGAEQA
jgi:GNAT superfamily N-acetyltransferase